MRSILIVLGYVAGVLSLIFALTPLFKIGFLTGAAALVLGIGAFFLGKKSESSGGNAVKILFALTVIALLLSTYKTFFVSVEVAETEEMIEMQEQSEQDAIEELEELDLEELELDEFEEDVDFDDFETSDDFEDIEIEE